MDVRRTLPWGLSTDVDGWFVAGDRCCDRVYGRAGPGGGLWAVESHTLGQNSSNNCRDFCSDQISHRHRTQHLYAVGAGTGDLRTRIRRDCRPNLSGEAVPREGDTNQRLVRVFLVLGVFLSLAFLHAVMFSNFVRHYSAARPYCTSDDCALTAAHKATDDSSACR